MERTENKRERLNKIKKRKLQEISPVTPSLLLRELTVWSDLQDQILMIYTEGKMEK